jgi:protein-tyrosine phosphatase
LLQQGVLTQMMASSLIGMQGNTARRTAESLLKEGLIHCIASAAHGLHTRPPAVVQSLQRARQLLGQARVYQMVESLPAAIVNNEEHSLTLSRNDTYLRRGER